MQGLQRWRRAVAVAAEGRCEPAAQEQLYNELSISSNTGQDCGGERGGGAEGSVAGWEKVGSGDHRPPLRPAPGRHGNGH